MEETKEVATPAIQVPVSIRLDTQSTASGPTMPSQSQNQICIVAQKEGVTYYQKFSFDQMIKFQFDEKAGGDDTFGQLGYDQSEIIWSGQGTEGEKMQITGIAWKRDEA